MKSRAALLLLNAGKEGKQTIIHSRRSPGIWNGLPGSELDGEWGKVALLPLPGELG